MNNIENSPELFIDEFQLHPYKDSASYSLYYDYYGRNHENTSYSDSIRDIKLKFETGKLKY